MEDLYDNLGDIQHLKIRGAKSLAAKLREHKDQAFLSKQLATVEYAAPVNIEPKLLRRRSAELGSLQELGQIMGGRGDGLFERLANSAQRSLAQ